MKTRRERIARCKSAAGKAAWGIMLLAAGFLAGCGGSGSGNVPAAVNSLPAVSAPTSHLVSSSGNFALTSDSYGMANATYLSATSSSSGLTLRAAIASSMTDPEYRTVARIDIPDPGAVAAGAVYSLGGTGSGPAFPGTIYFFNGHQSTLLQTVGGTITFNSYGSSAGSPISGSFRAVILDGGDSAKGSYSIAGDFSFTSGSYGAILPAPAPVPAVAVTLYAAKCASCHSLGALDPTRESGPELALKGGKLDLVLAEGTPAHQGISLAGGDVSALKVLLNVN